MHYAEVKIILHTVSADQGFQETLLISALAASLYLRTNAGVIVTVLQRKYVAKHLQELRIV